MWASRDTSHTPPLAPPIQSTHRVQRPVLPSLARLHPAVQRVEHLGGAAGVRRRCRGGKQARPTRRRDASTCRGDLDATLPSTPIHPLSVTHKCTIRVPPTLAPTVLNSGSWILILNSLDSTGSCEGVTGGVSAHTCACCRKVHVAHALVLRDMCVTGSTGRGGGRGQQSTRSLTARAGRERTRWA